MATFVVTTALDVANGNVSEDDLSLREAIELANGSAGPDRITFADDIEYIALEDALPTITDGLRLVGGRDVVLDANVDGDADPKTKAMPMGPPEVFEGARRGLNIGGDGIEVTINGLTITGGVAANGAGIQSGAGVDLTIVDCTIVRNLAGGDALSGRPTNGGFGGGILARGDCTILGSDLRTNSAGKGGGVAIFGEAEFLNAKVIRNGAWPSYEAHGAGVFAAGDVTLENTEVTGNNGTNQFGYYAGNGGGIFSGGNVRLTMCEISRNINRNGGGIAAEGTVIAHDSVIARNRATIYHPYLATYADGGGISADAVRLVRSEVSGNRVGARYAFGGGIKADQVELISSSVNRNRVDGRYGYGGGIWIGAGSLAARDSTLAWNVVDGDASEGGGLFAAGRRARLTLDGVTLTGNQAGNGGAIAAADASLTLTNCIVVGNMAEHLGDDVIGSPRLRSSLVGGDGREIFAETMRIVPGVFGGHLGENGGFARTVSLRGGPDNPAVGAASDRASPTDQRGVARDSDPDIGAFELTRGRGVTIVGGKHSEVIKGTSYSDRLDGAGRDDLVIGLGRADTLSGGDGDDSLKGGYAGDSLSGGAGRDRLVGGRAGDLLRGGDDADRFVASAGFGADTIGDFDADPGGGQDFIDLRLLGVSPTTFGDRVTITDVGRDTLVGIVDHGSFLCRRTTGDGYNVITVADFLLVS